MHVRPLLRFRLCCGGAPASPSDINGRRLADFGGRRMAGAALEGSRITMTTTRTILFDSPFLLGFDHTRALIDRAAKAAAESYPPYNVEQMGEADVRITLAVAGFTPDELNITLEGRQLTVAGKRED